ncbi:MAG: succinylglutamate desuccinylase/aspartoacylase family protein [Candidatus Bathyarchaeia archaeon]
MKNSFQIGGVSASPGAKVRGRFSIGFTPISSVEMPFTLINGVKDGPLLTVTSGVHGTEYTGIEATMRLAEIISAEELNGAVALVHIVNTPGFQAKVPFICPIDGLNINRIFPGKPDGSMSHRIAYVLFSQLVSKSNYYIDLHCGDIPEEHVDVAYYDVIGGKTDAVSEEMARCFSTSYIQADVVPGSSETEACKLGVPAITSEAGELGKLEEHEVKVHIEGVLNVMKRFQLLNAPVKPTHPKKLGERRVVRSEKAGLLHRKAKCGEAVTEGQVLGEIVDVYGDTLETVKSPISGVIIMAYPSPAVNSGDYLYGICPLVK